MRIFARTVLVTMIMTVAVLAAWSLIRESSSTGSASAASALQVPSYCIPPELPGIRSLLSKTSNPSARQLLLVKLKAAEQAAQDCAASATAHPPAKKPGVAALLPTVVPAPTAALAAGIQHAELMPASNFLPASDGYNMWTGTVNGHLLGVFAGSISSPNDPALQSHPDWASQPELHEQGALRVEVDGNGLTANEYPTPGRHGALQFVSSCGSLLVLRSADNTTFTFDAAALAFVARSTSCPPSTP